MAGSPRPTMKEYMRRTPRFPFVAPLNIFQEQTPGSHRQFLITTKDISLGGVGINCGKELLVNEQVILVMKHDGVRFASHARVVHCRQKEHGYRIGLLWELD